MELIGKTICFDCKVKNEGKGDDWQILSGVVIAVTFVGDQMVLFVQYRADGLESGMEKFAAMRILTVPAHLVKGTKVL